MTDRKKVFVMSETDMGLNLGCRRTSENHQEVNGARAKDINRQIANAEMGSLSKSLERFQ